jgi:biotin synthase-related radical SAM superfamily protein
VNTKRAELEFAWDVAAKQYTRQVRLTGSRSEESKAAWERASKRLDELVEHVGDEARKAAVESRKAAA